MDIDIDLDIDLDIGLVDIYIYRYIDKDINKDKDEFKKDMKTKDIKQNKYNNRNMDKNQRLWGCPKCTVLAVIWHCDAKNYSLAVG